MESMNSLFRGTFAAASLKRGPVSKRIGRGEFSAVLLPRLH